MQQLPAKDQQVFRSIVKFYETKQYKKGVKAADSILKKHADHGETLCMKGLTLSYLDKKQEAYELVRKGLKNDPKSHVCWHVYGLLYRQDRDFHQAVKCYRCALRIDADNMQILRDLSLLQIHRRDLVGFAETRRKLLQVKPNNRLNWVGYAIAEHLCKSYEFAWTCLDNYENTFKGEENVPEYENSELYMYKASIMEEAGKFDEALDCLKQHEKEIMDKFGFLEMKARLCMFLERFEDAAELYRRLVGMNTEHHTYILAYMACQKSFHRFWPPLPAPRGQEGGEEPKPLPPTIVSFPQSMHPDGMPIWGWLLPPHALKANRRIAIGSRQYKRQIDAYEPMVPLTSEEEEQVGAFFEGLQKEHPKSDSLPRLELFFLSGALFEKRCDTYLRIKLHKGVSSLFRLIRPLYFQPGKAEIIEKLLKGYIEHLEEEVSWFGPNAGEGARPLADNEEEEPPSTLLFAYMVAAQHFDYLGKAKEALDLVEKAIVHTPTAVEVYSAKARIYKHAGDLEKSAKLFDEVRQMDLADRFLNTQCVRALLRVDDVTAGQEKALLFSKEPDSAEAANLHDMQCMWYESAMGRSFTRQQKYGKALKQFHETFKHFNDIAEDQFDFHSYCLRKTTLKTYVAMLRMQERLFSHKFYRRAAKDAIRIYLELFDQNASGKETKASDTNVNEEVELSAEEKRRLKHKKKREDKKAEDEKAKQAVAAGGKAKKVDDDPDGEKLLEKDPMEEANKLVKTLMASCMMDTVTHVLLYETCRRQGKWLHCLQAVIKLWELTGKDLTHYKLIEPLAHFCFVANLGDAAVPKAVLDVILAEMAPILGAPGPFENVDAFRVAAVKFADAVQKKVQEESSKLPVIEVLNCLKCLKHTGRDMRAFLESWRAEGAFSLKECHKMLNYLEAEYGLESSIYTRFKARCLEIFPLLVIK